MSAKKILHPFIPKRHHSFTDFAELLQCWPTACGGSILLSRSSFAAPHVTGIVALLLEAFPSLTPEEAKMALKSVCS